MPLLREILRDPKSYDLSHALFAKKASLGPDSDCLILDPDDVDDVEDVPEPARAAGYDYILMMDAIDGVINNLKAQVKDPPDSVRFLAFKHYFDRDAFIEI